eukprot:g15378.t1
MVLYYWWRDPSAEEVLWPISTMNMHWWFKGTQLGLFGGLAAGMAVGLSKRGCTYQSVLHDVTRYMKFGGKLGLPYAAVRNITDNAQVNLDVLKERAFKVETSKWHNRVDIALVAGAIGGRSVLSCVPVTAGVGFASACGLVCSNRLIMSGEPLLKDHVAGARTDGDPLSPPTEGASSTRPKNSHVPYLLCYLVHITDTAVILIVRCHTPASRAATVIRFS